MNEPHDAGAIVQMMPGQDWYATYIKRQGTETEPPLLQPIPLVAWALQVKRAGPAMITTMDPGAGSAVASRIVGMVAIEGAIRPADIFPGFHGYVHLSALMGDAAKEDPE